MFASALPQAPAKKRVAGGPKSVTLLAMFKISRLKSMCYRRPKTYRLPCNPAAVFIDCEDCRARDEKNIGRPWQTI